MYICIINKTKAGNQSRHKTNIMTKQELIEKLKELGVYDQWERYVRMDAISTGTPFISRCNHLLGCDFDWEDFIVASFPWKFTDEGWDFWNGISKR